MKKYIVYSILLAGVALSGCSSSFLDQEPPLYIEPGDIYNNADRLEATVLGLYGSLKNDASSSFMGGKTYLVFDNRGEDIVNTDPNLVTLANTYRFNVGRTDAENAMTWEMAYAAINRANTFLEELEGAKETVGEKYEQYKAEAKFVRALSYYYLNNLYATPYVINPEAKSVPLRLKAEKNGENNGLKRSTVKEVYEQILSDLENISALPVKTAANEETVTRATQAAAYMLRMRVYMSMNNWAEAVKAGKSISGYVLTPKFADLFKAPYYTDETIFSLPMKETNRPNTQQGLAEYYYAKNTVLWVDMETGIMSKPNYNVAEDARVQMKNEKNQLMKFTDAAQKLDWAPIFRYAETLLNLAECYVNLGGTENEAQARECLKQVRFRSLPEASNQLDVDHLSGEALKLAVYNERRLEFIGEAMRGIDVLRRGANFERKVQITPQSNGYIWPIPQSEELMNPDLNK